MRATGGGKEAEKPWTQPRSFVRVHVARKSRVVGL